MCACGCCRLDGWLCCLSTTVWFSSSWYDIFLCLGDLDKQNMYDQRQEVKSMVVSMLKNWSHRYSSHNSNIKCIDSTIKCIDFASLNSSREI